MSRDSRIPSSAAECPGDPQPSTSSGPSRFYDLSSDDESGDRFVPRGRCPIDSDSDLSSDSGDDSDLVSVSQQDVTLDSEELLSERNCPGFRWLKKEKVPREYDF